MLAEDQTSFDCEYNGGLNAIDSERIHLQTSVNRAVMTSKQQLDQHRHQQQSRVPRQQQQQQHDEHDAEQVSTIDTAQQPSPCCAAANHKKSVMLNLKSGAINSTVEELGSLSTRFGGPHKRNACWLKRWHLSIVGILFVGLCCFVAGAVVMRLSGARYCDGEYGRRVDRVRARMCVCADPNVCVLLVSRARYRARMIYEMNAERKPSVRMHVSEAA